MEPAGLIGGPETVLGNFSPETKPATPSLFRLQEPVAWISETIGGTYPPGSNYSVLRCLVPRREPFGASIPASREREQGTASSWML